MADGTYSGAWRGGSGRPAADRDALGALFDRLRDQVTQAEGRAEAAFGELASALDQPGDPETLLSRTESALAAPREAASGAWRLAGEVDALAGVLRGRAAREEDDGRLAALCSLGGELRDRAGRLSQRLAEAEAEVARALERLSASLGQWDSAAADQERRLAETVEAELAAEARRTAEIVRLLEVVERRVAEPAAVETRAERRAGARSAALLTSAGVACLGLAALIALLGPPFPLGAPPADPQELAAQAEVALRGRILVAPPRIAQPEEFALPPGSLAPGPEADVQKRLAAAMAAADAGQPAALRALAEAGQVRAQMYLAKLYELGRGGLTVDSVQARRWTAQAAEAGDPVAMHNLALYYLEGRGGARDDAAAARLLKRAAAAGIADSQFNLGLVYETGAGVDRNLVEAYRWFQIAAGNGDLKARERAVALEARLSPQELASADRRVARFRPGAEDGDEEAALIPGAATVAEAQKKLARLGFYIGPTDGRETLAYRQAVEAYRDSLRSQAATGNAPGDR